MPRISSIDGTLHLTQGILLICLAGTLLACMDGIAKYLSATLPIVIILWGRYFFHLLLLFMLTPPRRLSKLFHTHQLMLQLLRSVCLLGITGCMYNAIRTAPLSDTTAVMFLAPVLVTALSALFLGERVNLRRWIAVGIGFSGMLLIVRPGGTMPLDATLLSMAAALLLGFYMLLTRLVQRTDTPSTSLLYATLVGAITLSILLPWYWTIPTWPESGFMVLIGALGGSGHWMIIHATQRAPLSVLSPFMYTQVVAAVIFSLIVFNHLPDWLSLAGIATVIGSGLYVWYCEYRENRRRPVTDRPATAIDI